MSTLHFHKFLHTVYKYMLNYVVKISVMSAEYFEYYTIILRGPFFSWTRCSILPKIRGMKQKTEKIEFRIIMECATM